MTVHQMEKLFDELFEHLEDVLAVGYFSLVTCLAEACRRLRLKQDDFIMVSVLLCEAVREETAMSIFSPFGSQSSDGIRMFVCVCVFAMNLKCALCWHIHISVHSVPCQCIYTHTHASTYHLRTAD